MKNTDVFICGAGPTGLVLALWLKRAGINIRIIDKAEKAGTASRAIVVHARTLEFYRQLSIDQIAIERGVEFKAVNLWVKGKKKATIPFGNEGITISPYPYSIIFPQDLHEEMLTEQLALEGVEIEHSTELTGFEIKNNAVSIQLKTKEGEEECTAAFLAGCDGAHSFVRGKLDTGFAGGTYDDIFFVADIIASGPVVQGDMNGALDDADFLAIFPMKGEGRIRLVGAMKMESQPDNHLTWDDVGKHIIERLQMEVKEVRWFSTYKVHHRVSSHFRKGPVFILGDAAHVHSPVGGQGMNTGIGDAVNLAWKLASVLKNKKENEPLLASYETERIAFARKLVRSTDRAFVFVNKRSALATFTRTRLVPPLMLFLSRFKFIRLLIFKTLSQTSISYHHSFLSEGSVGKIKAGDRLPWIRISDTADNYMPLKQMNLQVHCYGTASQELRIQCEEKKLPLFVFERNDHCKKAGIKEDAVFLIRPDGYIGYAGTGKIIPENYFRRFTGHD